LRVAQHGAGGGGDDVGHLVAALALMRGDGCWEALADPRYEALHGMFGGWAAAVALAAVEADADPEHVASALAINYLVAIPPGTAVRICTRRLAGGRSVSHWFVELRSAEGDRELAAATAVLANRQPTDGHLQAVFPEVPGPEDLAEWHPPDAAGRQTSVRPIEGHPPFGRMNTRSLAWVREISGRPVDRLQLAYLSDATAPRSFFWSDGPRLSATLAMTTYFHATADELAAVGDDYVLSEATGTRGSASIADQSLCIWSRAGVLLSTSHQVCLYR
jgi:acyl-CoA thioesterase